MENDHEKRISPRHAVKGPITLHANMQSPMEIDAHVLNCSEEGICFCAKKQLFPGATVLFKTSSTGNYLCACKNREDCLLRSISFVTVKWCRESSHNGQSVYTMGAAYMMPC